MKEHANGDGHMVETEEGGTVLLQELFGEQGCERKIEQCGESQ